VLSLTAFIPGTVDLTSRIGSGVADGPIGGGFGTTSRGFTIESALWTTFWSLLAGLVLAAIGGLLGGRLRRRPVSLRSTGRCRAAQGPPARRPSRMPVKTR
jgi:hypothetical protein